MNARNLIEAAHRKECCCGFCKNRGNIGNLRKKAAGKPEPEEKPDDDAVEESEGAVKLSKGVGLDGPATRAYHGMTSKQAMTPEWKPKARIAAAGELVGMSTTDQKGFQNKGEGRTTSGARVPKTRPGESRAAQMVDRLLS
jgi:hypothetical protein